MKKMIITEEKVKEAAERMKEAFKAKESVDRRATENEEYWRQRHWGQIKTATEEERPASAWLFNSIANKHADIMDNFPKPNILPRAQEDEMEAESLSEIMPVILTRNRYQKTYSDKAYDFLKEGTCITGVFWDSTKENGVGDITIKRIDIHNVAWSPDAKDIQEAREVFTVAAVDNDVLVRQYPEMEGNTGTEKVSAEYHHDDAKDDSKKSLVVDWYYKTTVYEDVSLADGISVKRPKTILNFAKFCNGILLYSSENAGMKNGFYDHGMYPFVVSALFPIKDSITGFGYIDVMRDPQKYVDALDHIITKNAQMTGEPRYFASRTAGVNIDDFIDVKKKIVEFDGTDIDNKLKPIEVKTIPAFIVQHRLNKIDELKETSGNRDFSQGSTQGGITAASAIAALQEAGSKLARDMIRILYEGFEAENYFCVELIRQFYTEPRSFRIDLEDGAFNFVDYDNANMQGRKGVMFDINIVAEKKSPFSRAAQNEAAKEMYGMGLFSPGVAEQAMVCLEMMEFEGKDKVKKMIKDNSLLMQQVQAMQMALMEAERYLPGIAAQAGLQVPTQEAPTGAKREGTAEERAAKKETDATLTAKSRVKAARQAQL